MPTRNKDEEKLNLLRSLASEAFGELDRGHGAVIDGEPQLTEFVGQIARRAAEEVEHQSANG